MHIYNCNHKNMSDFAHSPIEFRQSLSLQGTSAKRETEIDLTIRPEKTETQKGGQHLPKITMFPFSNALIRSSR